MRAALIHGLHTFDRAYLPVIGLLASLCLQVTLLVTGELRKWTESASVPGWLAYVLSDIVAVYLLGMLSRTQVRADLYGLWSVFLIYHLGGPDNFTAYERADSELWIRHLLLKPYPASVYRQLRNCRQYTGMDTITNAHGIFHCG